MSSQDTTDTTEDAQTDAQADDEWGYNPEENPEHAEYWDSSEERARQRREHDDGPRERTHGYPDAGEVYTRLEHEDGQDAQELEVITPSTTDTSESEYDSPVERMEKELPQKLYRNFIAADDGHPLVRNTGSKEALLSKTPVAVQKMLADGIYESIGSETFFREWLQNHVAAVTREAKRRVVNAYGQGALFYEHKHDHESFDEPKLIHLPKKPADIIEMAKDLGYTPTIEFTLDHDDGALITRDNGIGMTAGEVIEVWNEPTESGSGVDLSSAGNKGIGSLTWTSIAGDEGAMMVKTRTKRQTTESGETVPQYDRDGFHFYSFFGGVVPVSDEVPDGFSGIEFKIPIDTDLVDPDKFEDSLAKYAEVVPTQVSWQEIKGGVKSEEEYGPTTFVDRYDREPAIALERPGEFTLVMDTPEVVPKGGSTNDTFLLDNPISRNTSYHQSLDTLWNDHLQLHNEQGLIIAGPNRGRRAADVDELAGEKADITDDSKPMPDVPLPQPVASRDNFKKDEAHERFFAYLEEVAVEEELSTVTGFVNGFLNTDSLSDALDYIRTQGSEWSLFRDLVKKHGGYKTYRTSTKLARWLDGRDDIDYDKDDAVEVQPGEKAPNGAENPDEEPVKNHYTHPKYEHVKFLYELDNEVDVATADTRGNPNKKNNRRNEVKLGQLIGEEQHWPIFVGAKINEDRAKVIVHEENYPDAAILKVRSYGEWQDDPFNAGLVKEVPFTHDEADECDEDWHVPDSINDAHTRDHSSATKTTTNEQGETIDLTDPDNFQKRPVDIRCTENAAIDLTATVGDVMEAMDDTEPGETITLEDNRTLNHADIVVFPTTHDINISDNYDLSEYAALIRCNKSESEALLEYEQAHLPDDFLDSLGSTKLTVYDPDSRQGWNQNIDTLLEDDPDKEYVWVYENSDDPLDAVKRDPIRDVDPSDDHYDHVRQLVLDKFVSADDGEWRMVEWPDDYETRKRISAYVDCVYDGSATVTIRYTDYPSLNVPSTHFRTSSIRNIDKAITRGKYPQWAIDSDAWSQLNKSSFRGPPDYLKEMLEACRDLGIDPANDHDIRQTLVMLGSTCPDDGGDD